MSDNIYDILGKLNGLAPKENPVSTAEPVYESIDPRGDIIEAVSSLEEKYSNFNKKVVSEKSTRKKIQNDELNSLQSPALNYKGDNPVVKNFLATAKSQDPASKNDLEAAMHSIAVLSTQSSQQRNDLARTQKNLDSAQQMLAKTQQNQDALRQVITTSDQRFRTLNDKVAKGEITAADQQAAIAAQSIEKDQDAATASIDQGQSAPAQSVAPPAAVPSAPKLTQKVTSKAKSAELTNQPDPNVGAGLKIASPGLNPNYPVDTTADAANTDPLSQYLGRTKKVANMKETQLEEMDTGVSSNTGIQNAQKIANFLSAHQKYREALENPQSGYTPQQPPVSVVLQFTSPDGRQNVVNLSKSTVDKLINSLKRPGTTNQDRSDFTNIILADADKLRDYMNNLNAPRPVRKVMSVNKGQDIPDMDQDKFSGNKKLPQGSQEPQLQESLGNKTMTKPTSIIEAVRSVEDKKLREAAKPDFLDLDKDGDTDEPMKKAAKDAKKHEPAEVDKDAVAKRKRLQALKDKQEDERAERGDDDKSSSRVVKGRAYGGSAQKDDKEDDDLDESGLQAYLGKKKYGKEGMKALQQAGRDGASKEKMAMLRAKHDKMDEVAPPGAKAERMVKHIKKGYAKDGKVTPKEKGIAYATAWKAKKAGKLEESRNAESSEYTYETIGRILCDEQSGLDANSEAFVKAVYDELIEMKLTPKAARWLVHYDEDFLSDCATSYGHFCASKEKEMAECGSPMNSFVSEEPLLDAQQELDEIARLAGLTRENYNPMVPGDSASPLTYAGCPKCNADPCCCEDENAMDEGMGCSEDELNEAATRKDFRMVADLLKSIPDMAKRTELAMYHADIFKQQNSRFKKEMFLAAAGIDTTPIKDESIETEGNAFTGKLAATEKGGEFELDGKKFKDTSDLEEEMSTEGNEFSGALAKAKASGEKEFEVDGKKYTVKEDINVNVSANGEEDVVNLIRKLSGMPMIAIQAQPAEQSCGICGSSPCGCESLEEDGPTERDVEYTNSPREEVAGTDAAIPAGADLNRAKRQYKKEYPGDNPMAVAEAKEESLWKAYEEMINDVKA